MIQGSSSTLYPLPSTLYLPNRWKPWFPPWTLRPCSDCNSCRYPLQGITGFQQPSSPCPQSRHPLACPPLCACFVELQTLQRTVCYSGSNLTVKVNVELHTHTHITMFPCTHVPMHRSLVFNSCTSAVVTSVPGWLWDTLYTEVPRLGYSWTSRTSLIWLLALIWVCFSLQFNCPAEFLISN